jgi:hypothetical protein
VTGERQRLLIKNPSINVAQFARNAMSPFVNVG